MWHFEVKISPDFRLTKDSLEPLKKATRVCYQKFFVFLGSTWTRLPYLFDISYTSSHHGNLLKCRRTNSNSSTQFRRQMCNVIYVVLVSPWWRTTIQKRNVTWNSFCSIWGSDMNSQVLLSTLPYPYLHSIRTHSNFATYLN